ncbi:MAG: hypothetical protein AB1758_14780 [Candidatus Eremiobacterota bacterium]
MSTCRRPQGYTVMEVLVTSCILLLLVAGIHRIVTFGLRYYQVARAQEVAHHEALVATRWVSNELVQSNLPSVVIGPTHVAFPSATPETTPSTWTYRDGSLLWHKWVAFYYDPDTGELVRAVVNFPGGAVDSPQPPPNLDVFQNSPDASRVVARGVTDFQTTPMPNDLIQVSVTAQVPTASDRFTKIKLTHKVQPGN